MEPNTDDILLCVEKGTDDSAGQHFLFQVNRAAPNNWLERLEKTGLPFVVSPLVEANNSHSVIVSYDTPVTFKTACKLCKMLKCSPPGIIRDGLTAYHTHIDFSKTEKPEDYNGWEIPLNAEQTATILAEIFGMIDSENCDGFSSLLEQCNEKGREYVQVAGMNIISITMYAYALIGNYIVDEEGEEE